MALIRKSQPISLINQDQRGTSFSLMRNQGRRALLSDEANSRVLPCDCRRPLVFMHVPKCGGISLVKSLIEAVTPSSIMGGFDLSLFGGFADFRSLDPAIQETIYLDRLPDGAFDFVGGHMAFSTLERRFPSARRMTVLRHPAARLISFYLYWRSLPTRNCSAGVRGLSVEAFARPLVGLSICEGGRMSDGQLVN